MGVARHARAVDSGSAARKRPLLFMIRNAYPCDVFFATNWAALRPNLVSAKMKSTAYMPQNLRQKTGHTTSPCAVRPWHKAAKEPGCKKRYAKSDSSQFAKFSRKPGSSKMLGAGVVVVTCAVKAGSNQLR